MDYSSKIAAQLNLGVRQVEKTIALLEAGATVPFIARYRKEATGNLNEVQISAIRQLLLRYKELDARRAVVLQSIAEQGKLNDKLRARIEQAETLTALEDLYLPYKPKRRTRAEVARERGLEPLAVEIWRQYQCHVEELAAAYVNEELGVPTVEEALAGARDILAEKMAQDIPTRNSLRHLFKKQGVLSSQVVKGKENEAKKYRSWWNWQEPAMRAPSHRVLAMFRGEAEGVLRVHIALPNDTRAITTMQQRFLKGISESQKQVNLALHDSYKRLLAPTIETELHTLLKEQADEKAIAVFAENLRQLLLASPLGQKRTLAIDPGFRTGCKVVCLDAQGQLLHNETIYPFTSVREERAAIAKLEELVEAFHIQAIAIGNGTAGRETEEVVKKCHFRAEHLVAVMVDESGASVYSAGEVARREFPDYDITVRGAVSIGRRLMDPLSELVKIEPKSIGVGQYQHDVNQAQLQQSLETVVESCVNSVGVELNTASEELLRYVSGIGPVLAQRIVEHRNVHGAFPDREALLQVRGVGPKVYEQCAGFLRVQESSNPLDRSAVHPERYALVQRMAQSVEATVQELMEHKELRERIDITPFVSEECGLPTLQDILQELDKPGRDPRKRFEVFQFDPTVSTFEDVKPGMVLPGVVTNITAFGAFVDVGVHQDGLVHISQLCSRRITNPAEVVHMHQQVRVRVLEVDEERHRFALTMKDVE